MQTTIDLDEELLGEVTRARALVQESQASVIRMAIRAGLPLVTGEAPQHRPEGYFADAYPGSDERLALEAAMVEMPQSLDR